MVIWWPGWLLADCNLCQYLAWWWRRYRCTVAWWFFVVALIVHGPGRSFSWCRLLQIHDGLAGEIVGVCRHGFCVTRDDSDYWDYLKFAMWTLRIVVIIWKLWKNAASYIHLKRRTMSAVTLRWQVVILISFYVNRIKTMRTSLVLEF
jgi:hypothetical protein